MADISVSLQFPHLDVLSDGTFRRILKELSRRLRRVLERDLEHIINNLELSERQSQSLRDRVAPKLDAESAYYVSGLSRGSLTIDVDLAQMAFWLVTLSAGEVVKEAVKRTKTYKKLIEILSSQKREEVVKVEAKNQFEEGGTFLRFRFERTRVTRDPDGAVHIDVRLETIDEFRTRIPGGAVKEDFVLQQLKDKLEEARALSDQATEED